MQNNEEVLIIPVPSLVATLLNKEQAKGSPLSQDEVIEIRNNCPCVAMTKEQYQAVCDSRQYMDIDPENAWEEWQVEREHLSGA